MLGGVYICFFGLLFFGFDFVEDYLVVGCRDVGDVD